MPLTTPRRRTWPDKALLAAGLLAALPAAAQDLPDLHLHAGPRDAREAARVARATAPPDDPTQAQRFELRSGGAGTVRARPGVDALSHPAANLTTEQRMAFTLGEALFQRGWVSAPSSTIASDGLGPLFNARACSACHVNDGRGLPPDGSAEAPSTLVLRLARLAPEGTPGPEGIAEWIATLPDPVYGMQLQDSAIQGQQAEGRVSVTWEDVTVELAGGETANLRRPVWQAVDLGFGPLAEGVVAAPRVAPPLVGLGLLEAIASADILAGADPEDADGDGISGRASIVWSAEYNAPMLGRFGHKAVLPTLRAQAASAFFTDIGLSTSLHPQGWGECTEAQVACRAAPDGGDTAHGGVEVPDALLDLVTFYVANLGVPARRGVDDPEVLRGRSIFYEAGCAACHRPAYVTATLHDRDQHSFQLIWPYTDLLLHDMGEGLADGLAEGRASGSEWRTAPLWGLGLTAQVAGEGSFLHDGRARSPLEAILWHGGEGQAARDAVAALAPDDRAALIRYLESL